MYKKTNRINLMPLNIALVSAFICASTIPLAIFYAYKMLWLSTSLAATMLLIGSALSLYFTRKLKAVTNAAQIALHKVDSSIVDTSSNAYNFLLSFVNITSGKLQESQDARQGLLNGIAVPFSVFSSQDKTVFTNQQMLDLMKIPGKPEDHYGKTSGEFLLGDKSQETLSTIALRDGKSYVADRILKTRTGEERHVHISTSPYFDENKTILGTISIWLDQTDVVLAKEEAIRAKAEGMLQAAEQLESVVEIVTSASEQLSAQIEQSSRGTEEQTNRIGETATAMEEMNATVMEVAKNASNAASTADQAKVKAEEGSKVVSQVVQGIEQVQHQSEEMKNDMGNLGKQAEGIGQILNVISDIADQTNLLALNAAIEAARAGEAGRGFAVVADEVRKLAEKTMTATKEVGAAIRGIQEGTKKNIDNVERSCKNIEEVTNLATNSGEALKQIVTLADKTTDQVRSIATASEQQSATSEEINRSIESVNRISSETADGMRESAQAVGELANQAQVLKRLIDEMKSDGGSGTKELPAGKKTLALGRG